MNKIALVMPYYGVLPPYFNFFLRSLEGKNLDVLFFSDLAVEKHPENFKPIEMSFDEFKRLAAEKLGVPVRLDSPKRLCDFKPMYGKIFEDYLAGYDYWAFGDCDLIFGNAFSSLLERELGGGPDVFSLERLFCCGPLCFFKNDEKTKMLYVRARNWKDAVAAVGAKNIGFDEIGSSEWFDLLRHGEMTLEDCSALVDSFSPAVFRSTDLKLALVDAIEQNSLSRGEIVKMSQQGDLTLNGKPIAVYHYIRAKQRRYFKFIRESYDKIEDYVIDNTGFYVTNRQKRFRRLLRMVRKARAAVVSLQKNGIKRIFRRKPE